MNPLAGQSPSVSDLIDVSKLIRAYENDQPDPNIASQQVSFGTSGHRGSSYDRTFNRHHILAITQAICSYRKIQNINGPLFLGFDTHALSMPAFQTALGVLAANDVTTVIAKDNEFTPTPVISHSILNYNRGRSEGLADGIILTPSHNPPREGGFKYNPPHGGPAEKNVTDWIQNEANKLLFHKLDGVKVHTYDQASRAPTTRVCDFIDVFVRDLGSVIDFDIIREEKIKIGVDPLGGAGVHYWQPIAEIYNINLTVTNNKVDPRFGFMNYDWDGQIRMDPSSPYAMQSLIKKRRKFDIAIACDTDHDRHGIVTKSGGLMPPNHYLSAAIYYLFKYRSLWPGDLKIGKTFVTSQMIDRVADILNRPVYEVPVGFKWFVDGLIQEKIGVAGEESAGATFLRINSDVWTTDKDGFAPGLLAAEMTARTGKDPSGIYSDLTKLLGEPFYQRKEAAASEREKERIRGLSSSQIEMTDLVGDKIEKISTQATGNNAPFGGIKLNTKNGWVAIRPSGTESLYKIYAESFLSDQHANALVEDCQNLVSRAIKPKNGENFPSRSV